MSDQTVPLTGAEDINWDLSDLYAGVNDPNLDRDLDQADARADKLAEQYRGRIADLDAAELKAFMEEYEGISETCEPQCKRCVDVARRRRHGISGFY